LIAFLGRTMESSSQLPVRFALLILSALFVLSQEFGFEGILGAFAAGMIVGVATRGESGKVFRLKIDAVSFGWFTPFFFVGTGVGFDLNALTRDAVTVALIPTILVLLLIVRGVPVLLARRQLPQSQLPPLGLLCSVASLGLVVVITQIGLHAKSMSPDIAQALISAALLSSLVFPVIAGRLLPKSSAAASTASDPHQVV
jgi:Kef-type K+ transport system membrane component KefB